MPVDSMSSRLPAVVLERSQIEAVLAQCSRRAPTGVRNYALLTVLWRCGLRCDEALSLVPSDVRLDDGILVVRHGKGDKSRTLGLPGDVVSALLLWGAKRDGLKVPRGAPLFCTLKGDALDDSYVRHLCKRLGARAGLGVRVHAHGLRHAFAQELALSGVPTVVIRDALGHESIATTERYLRSIAPAEVIRVMRDR